MYGLTPFAPERMAWWREARFGMFVHWGLYALPAGVWNGREIPSLGEWIMRNAPIPAADYEQLARRFHPVKFDAGDWVGLAKRAGMKYIGITAKHHDGFAMFRSPSNPYNIVDATPFRRDPMAELAAACHRAGIRLCFYYSQAQDWHAPGGAGKLEECRDGQWSQPTVAPERFAHYLEQVAFPQVTELLTQYGPVGLIWFDTPIAMTPAQSRALADLVHRLQPECLVNGRVGNEAGDYRSLGDNQIPVGRLAGDWETPATINDTWGYKRHDQNWKPAGDLIYLLANLAGKGVNYLLNVGPTAEGEIPAPSIERLEAVGRWMDANGSAIYGTQAGPFPADFEWGSVTRKGRTLYLLVHAWPADGVLRLGGLRTRARRAALLAAPGAALPLRQQHDAAADRHSLEIALPAAPPDPAVSVIALELDGEADADDRLIEQPTGHIALPAYRAALASLPGTTAPVLTRHGVIEQWKTTGPAASWTFRAWTPGRYRVLLQTPIDGHEVQVEIAGQTLRAVLARGPARDPRRARYCRELTCDLGTVALPAPGEYRLRLSVLVLSSDRGGFKVAELRLVAEPPAGAG